MSIRTCAVASFVILSAGLAVAGSGVASVSPLAEPAKAASSTPTPEVQFLMDDLGLTADEATTRLRDIEFVSELRFEDLDPSFVAIEIAAEHDFRAVYQTQAQSIPAAVSDTLRGADVAVNLTLQTVPRSWEALQEAKLALAARLGGKADIRGDIASGQVLATVASDKDIPPGLTRIKNVPVHWRKGEMFESQVNGGKGWGSCTVGFVVKSTSSAQRGISTAAHCSQPGTTYGGVSWIYVNGHDGGSHDAEWYRPAVATPLDNSVSCCGGYIATITDRKWVAGMDRGVPVCKMGKETGFHCGYITDTYVCYNEPTGCTYFAMAKDGVDIAVLGDSGGPVFHQNQAFGWHVAGSGWTALYQPQQYSTTYGYEVAIS